MTEAGSSSPSLKGAQMLAGGKATLNICKHCTVGTVHSSQLILKMMAPGLTLLNRDS